MSKFTPGPWKVEGVVSPNVVAAPHGLIAAIRYLGNSKTAEAEHAANAALMAAAPDLLAALKRYLYAYQGYMDGQEDPNEIHAAERQARRAIEKAEGGGREGSP